jgi:hypothetical protein
MSDTDFPLDPDDPRVTAYALDEMHDAGARAGFEQILAHSPEARAMVEEIRALSGQLIAEYDEERRLAQAEPSNVIPLPGRRRAPWAGQLLRMAATLAVLGIAGVLLAPYLRGPRAVQMPVMSDARIEDGAVDQKRMLTSKKTVLSPQTVDGMRAPATVARSGVASQMAIPYGALNAPISSFSPSFEVSVNGKLDRTAPARRVEKENPIADDGSDLQKAPRAVREYVGALKPSVENSMSAVTAAVPPAAAPAAPASVASNAMGGGGAGGAGARATGTFILGDMPANAKDAFFQNRYATSDVNGADQSSVGTLRRTKAASETRATGQSSLDASGFISSADAPVATFAIAFNPDRQQSLGIASAAQKVEHERTIAGKTLSEFPFGDAPPAPNGPHGLAVRAESASCPWAPDHRLIRIAFKGRDPAAAPGETLQVQVKFNPAEVAAYRAAGGASSIIQLNAWQEATVLYEVALAKASQEEVKDEVLERLPVDRPAAIAQTARLRELRTPGLLTVAVQPAAVTGAMLSDTLVDEVAAEDLSSASADFKFAAAVAAYDLSTQAPRDKGLPNLELAIQLAQEGLGKDPGGYRAAFLSMLRRQTHTGGGDD